MEVVLVLAILMAGLGIGLPAYNKFTVQKEEDQFFQLLRNDIYYAQSEAYLRETSVTLIFRPESDRYDVYHNIKSYLVSRAVPASVSLIGSSNLTQIVFWSSGSIVGSGTIRFNTSSGERTVIVHLGKGRVVISE